MAESKPTFVLVGHCGPDTYLLKSAVQRAVPGAAVVSAESRAALESLVGAGSVLLINRVIEEDDFDTSSGIELIRWVRSLQGEPVALLISNHADAQAEAEAAGASQGFGKKEVNSARAADALRAAATAAGELLSRSSHKSN